MKPSTQIVLAMLEKAGKSGVCASTFLERGIGRFGARIFELRGDHDLVVSIKVCREHTRCSETLLILPNSTRKMSSDYASTFPHNPPFKPSDSDSPLMVTAFIAGLILGILLGFLLLALMTAASDADDRHGTPE